MKLNLIIIVIQIIVIQIVKNLIYHKFIRYLNSVNKNLNGSKSLEEKFKLNKIYVIFILDIVLLIYKLKSINKSISGDGSSAGDEAFTSLFNLTVRNKVISYAVLTGLTDLFLMSQKVLIAVLFTVSIFDEEFINTLKDAMLFIKDPKTDASYCCHLSSQNPDAQNPDFMTSKDLFEKMETIVESIFSNKIR